MLLAGNDGGQGVVHDVFETAPFPECVSHYICPLQNQKSEHLASRISNLFLFANTMPSASLLWPYHFLGQYCYRHPNKTATGGAEIAQAA